MLERSQASASARAAVSIRQMNVAICHEYYLTRIQEAVLAEQNHKAFDTDATYRMYKARCGEVDYADGENAQRIHQLNQELRKLPEYFFAKRKFLRFVWADRERMKRDILSEAK